MESILRLKEENIEEFAMLIPYEYFKEYEESDDMFLYGMKEEKIPCAVALLETDAKDVVIRYLNIYGRNSSCMHRFVNTIAYDMYKQGMNRLVWKYMEEEEFDYSLMLANLGFVSYPGDTAMFTFTIKQLWDAEILNKPFSNTVLLNDIGAMEIKRLCAEIITSCKDFIEMPIAVNDYIGDCSVIYAEDGIPKGMMLLEKNNNRLHIPYIYCSSAKPTAIIDMMRNMLVNAGAKYGEDMVCTAAVVEPVLIQIIEKITGISCKYQQIAIKELEYIGENEAAIKKEFERMSEKFSAEEVYN